MQRRIVGLDLGVATDHTAVILDQSGAELARRRVRPTRASLQALRQAALASAQPETVVEVVIEPTGPAWLPVAVFFAATGDTVYRVSSQKAADLRRYYRRHHKTNRIDATTLARIALLEGDALRPVELPRGVAAELDRQVRVTERLTEEIAAGKVRIRDLARQLMPTSGQASSARIARADLAILGVWGDPRTLAVQPIEALTELVTTISHRMHGRAKARRGFGPRPRRSGCMATLTPSPSPPWRLTWPPRSRCWRRWRRLGHRTNAAANSCIARWIRACWPAPSPGGAEVGGPLATAAVGRPGRFPDADRFVSYTGLVPGARETGATDRKGQPITKAGNASCAACCTRLPTPPRTRPPAGPQLLCPDG